MISPAVEDESRNYTYRYAKLSLLVPAPAEKQEQHHAKIVLGVRTKNIIRSFRVAAKNGNQHNRKGKAIKDAFHEGTNLERGRSYAIEEKNR